MEKSNINKKEENLDEKILRLKRELAELDLKKNVKDFEVSQIKTKAAISESKSILEENNKKIEELTKNINQNLDKKNTNTIDPGKMSRRDFFGVAGATAIAAVATSIASNEKVPTKIESVEGVKIPKFIFEKSAKGQEKYVSTETLKFIKQANKILESQSVGFELDPTKPDKLKSSNVVLAMLDLNDPSKGIETLEVKPNKNEGENNDGYQITIGENLGMATSFDVTVPEGRVVLAVKRKIERSSTKTIEDAIYSPYTPDLDIPLVRRKGFDYMVNLLKDAKATFKEKGKEVKSKFGSESEIAPGVSLEVIVMLSLVEQTDPGIFARNAKKIFEKYDLTGLTPEQIQALQKKADVQALVPMVQRGLTVVGQNEEDTKKYAVSKVGASGLLQLMPDTYASLEQKKSITTERDGKTITIEPLYPNNNLKADFLEGAVDHKNAARAAWLLLDSCLHEARKEPFFEKLQQDDDFRYKYLSACYNAGSRPVRKTIKENGDDWESKLPVNKDGVPETVRYVRIFTALRTLFQEDVPEEKDSSIFSRIYKYLFESKDEPPKNREIKVAKNKKNDRNRSEKLEANDIPPDLRGGGTSLKKQLDTAEKQGMPFIKNQSHLDELIQANLMVPLPEREDKIVVNKITGIKESERRYCTPETRKFLEEMAEASKKFNPDFEPLMINSGVRPDDVQQKMRDPKSPTYNVNATKISPHSYGSTVDIAYNANSAGYKGMSQAQLDWTEDYLIQKEKEGKIEATQEVSQTVFHIMVFKN